MLKNLSATTHRSHAVEVLFLRLICSHSHVSVGVRVHIMRHKHTCTVRVTPEIIRRRYWSCWCECCTCTCGCCTWGHLWNSCINVMSNSKCKCCQLKTVMRLMPFAYAAIFLQCWYQSKDLMMIFFSGYVTKNLAVHKISATQMNPKPR